MQVTNINAAKFAIAETNATYYATAWMNSNSQRIAASGRMMIDAVL
jgi:hypothetical protein